MDDFTKWLAIAAPPIVTLIVQQWFSLRHKEKDIEAQGKAIQGQRDLASDERSATEASAATAKVETAFVDALDAIARLQADIANSDPFATKSLGLSKVADPIPVPADSVHKFTSALNRVRLYCNDGEIEFEQLRREVENYISGFGDKFSNALNEDLSSLSEQVAAAYRKRNPVR